ncbi:MAG TPA: GDP-mannose 4,6-dehydratase [Chloroflexia bacterium]|nr:GDP-mannose 4,6-dehydratase [Chloroflexia bacterium]
MRALITGAGGFAGHYLATHLAQVTDWDLWGTQRPLGGSYAGSNTDVARRSELPGRRTLDATWATERRLQPVAVELADYGATRDALADIRPDFLFHLAAQSIVQRAFSDPESTLVNNIVGELNVLRAIKELNLPTRILLVGSSEEYGHVEPEDLPVDEDTPFRPENPYAVSKIAQDMLGLQYFLTFKVPVIRVRPFNHIGPGQGEQFVTAAFARQVAAIEAGQQEPVLHVGNLSAERDFTDVRDMVRAYHLAITEGEPGAVYNLGSGQATSISRILDTLLAMSTVAVRIERDPTRLRPADVPRIVCDPGRFRGRTGWEPRIALQTSLTDILNDWRQRVLADAPAPPVADPSPQTASSTREEDQ